MNKEQDKIKMKRKTSYQFEVNSNVVYSGARLIKKLQKTKKYSKLFD